MRILDSSPAAYPSITGMLNCDSSWCLELVGRVVVSGCSVFALRGVSHVACAFLYTVREGCSRLLSEVRSGACYKTY